MQVYKASEWRVAEGSAKIFIHPVTNVDVEVSCFEKMRLSGVCDGAIVPLKCGENFRYRAKLKGFTQLLLECEDPKFHFGYRDVSKQLHDGEPMNHDDPPAPPLPANNLLAQIREAVNKEAKLIRPPTLEPEDDLPNPYEVDDDDERFEEDIHAENLSAAAAADAPVVQPTGTGEPPSGDGENGPRMSDDTPA